MIILIQYETIETIRLDELVKEVYHCDYIPDEIIQATINGLR
jgi:hypothetical protein